MSFDEVETAQKVRDLIARQAKRVVQQNAPRAIIGRMVSVDPFRLKGMVWFPGDEQPVEVSLLNGNLPAKWQSAALVSGQPQDGSRGYGSQVVVQRLNGVLYVTDVLSGGSFAANASFLGKRLIHQLPNQGIDGVGSVIRAAFHGSVVGRHAQTEQAFSLWINNTNGHTAYESVICGPFVFSGGGSVAGGRLDIFVSNSSGTAPSKKYNLILQPYLLRYPDNTMGPNVWWRLLPEQTQFVDSTSFPFAGDDFHLDISVVDTELSDPMAEGAAIYYLRFSNVDGQLIYDVTMRASGFDKIGGIDSSNTFFQKHEISPVPPVGYYGFHTPGNAWQNPTAYRVMDSFWRDTLPTNNTWGKLPLGLGTATQLEWKTATAANSGIEYDSLNGVGESPHNLYDHYHAFFEFTATNQQKVMWLDDPSTYTDVDLFMRIALEDMPLTQSTRVGFRIRSDKTNNEINCGVQFMPSGDVLLRFVKQVAGVFSDVGSNPTVFSGYDTDLMIGLRVQVRGNVMRAKAWLSGPQPVQDEEPAAWQKTETVADAVNLDAGSLGPWAFVTSGSTTPVPTKVWIHDLTMELQQPNVTEDSDHGVWTNGPWRSGVLRVAQDVQRSLVHDNGEFSFDGTNLKWTGTIWATGIGSNDSALHWGKAGVVCPTSGDFPRLPNTNVTGLPLTATAAGMPLPEWTALYMGVPPGVSSGNDALNSWLFYVQASKRDFPFELPEWAVLVASRGSATAPIRLGTGKTLQPGGKLYKTNALTVPVSTWTVIPWNAQQWINYAVHSTGTNPSRIAALMTGKMYIGGLVSFAAAAASTRSIMIRKNAAGNVASGTELYRTAASGSATATDHTSVNFHTELDLVDTDYVEIFAFSRTATSLQITAPNEAFNNVYFERKG